jgi:hypothetical protein
MERRRMCLWTLWTTLELLLDHVEQHVIDQDGPLAVGFPLPPLTPGDVPIRVRACLLMLGRSWRRR